MEQMTVDREQGGRRRLGRRARLLVLAIVAVLVAVACETTATDRETTLELLNGSRAEVSAPPLVAEAAADLEADRWARQMRNSCTLAHRSDITEGIPDGWTMIGENVGVSSIPAGMTDAEVLAGLHEAFLASPGHADNVLEPAFDEVGVGAVKGDCPNVGGDDPEFWVVHIFVARD